MMKPYLKFLEYFVKVTYMNEVFIGATNYMVVGNCNGVDTAPRGLKHMNALQRADVPDLRGRKTHNNSIQTY